MRWAALWIVLLAAVLVPYFLFEDRFAPLAARIARGEMAAWPAAAAIGGLLALDVLLPVPSSVVATLAGALLGFWRGAAVCWLGMTAGCAMGYAIGRRASGAATRLVGAEGLDRASALAARHGGWAIVLARAVPVLAEATVVFAGIARAPALPLLVAAALANLGIAIAYAAVGAFAMEARSFLAAFFGAIAIPAMVMAVARLWRS
jgi:membrane protein DedA with SNARE-associated domain